ncbi:MAG: hypothetical protein ACRERC_20710 [Candidatus Binatia bacterium]
MANEAENGRRPRSVVREIVQVRPEVMRDLEVCQMVAFRIRETAKRVATLAARTESPLREQLTGLCQRLAEEERVLLEWSNRPPG